MKDVKKVVRKYQLIKLLVIAGIIILFAAMIYDRVTDDKDYRSAVSGIEVEEVSADEIALAVISPETFSPLKSDSADVQYIGRLIYSSLFTFDADMTPVPDLASETELNGNVLSIRLKDAEWKDGSYLDAEDVIFSFERIRQIGKKGPYYESTGRIESISGTGENVNVTFKAADDISLSSLAFPVVNSSEYSEDVEKDNTSIPEGTGKYRVDSYERGKEIKLVPNDSYYGEKPKSSLTVSVRKSTSRFETLVETGNISALLDREESGSEQIVDEGVKIYEFPGNQLEFAAFNLKKDFTDNPYFRKAVAYSIDRSGINRECYYRNLKSDGSIYIPGYLGAEYDSIYEEDTDKASEMLEKAGFSDRNRDGDLEDEKGKEVEIQILVRADDERRNAAADMIKDTLEEMGIKVSIKKAADAEYMAELEKGEFHILIGGMATDESMDFRELLSSDGGMNYTGLADKDLDAALDRFMSTADNNEKKAACEEVMKIMESDMAMYCFGYEQYRLITSSVLKGEPEPSYYSPYNGIESWYSIYRKVIVEEPEVKK